ncbi:hypothetical protein SAMN05216360_11817 [Methylobacterium phyllostachyos]|uniref:Uncharacterized protein n=1 Tax=Methylobacterium phyllostachyos TaxID=582672 RepID=A0A1H0I5E2_9HYPH|nr:hypothetical protein SAMN05216360_11817 [Methylobacterium phyllostachyos]
MNKDKPDSSFDPIWYDRIEPDVRPGPALNAAAYLLLLLIAGFRIAVSVYGLPDRLWCRTSAGIARHRAARN